MKDEEPLPLGLLLKQTQHALRVSLDQELAAMDMTMPQWGVLRAIAAQPGISGAAIARAAFLSPQGVNRVLTHLEAKGSIVRHPSATHGRVLDIHVTAAGQALLAQCEAAYEHIEYQMVGTMTPAEQEQVREVLTRWLAHLGAATA